MSDPPTLQPLLQSWYRALIPVVRKEWRIALEEAPIRLEDSGGMNATIADDLGIPNITISTRLMALLATFNSTMLSFGVEERFRPTVRLDVPQAVMDTALSLVFRMSAPGAAFPDIEQIVTRPGYEEYRVRYLEAARAAFETREAPLRALAERAGVTLPELRAAIESLAGKLQSPDLQLMLLEWEISFLLLHELAHHALGHVGADSSPEHEIEADLQAARLFLELPAGEAELTVRGVALRTLFVAVGLTEDLIHLVNRGTAYAIPDGMKASHRPIPVTHPNTRRRVRALTDTFRRELEPSRLLGVFLDYGLGEVKRQFRLGIVDYGYFKWYCRVRGLEMQSQHFVRDASSAARKALAEQVVIERGWDSIDLQWGPLADDLFPEEWATPILGG